MAADEGGNRRDEHVFKAFRVFDEDGDDVAGRLVDVTLDELSAGDVVIKAAYSSVNYKDALAATGAGKIMRRFPLVGGIDVSGTVESSGDARFKAGDPVLVTGYDLGVAHDGGYAQYVRVPADWVVPLPQGLSRVRRHGDWHRRLHGGAVDRRDGAQRPDAAGRSRHRDRSDRRRRQHGVQCLAAPRLRGDGADRQGQRARLPAIARRRGTCCRDRTLQMGTRPLEKAMWAGAIDPVGGETLAWLTRTMMHERLHRECRG